MYVDGTEIWIYLFLKLHDYECHGHAFDIISPVWGESTGHLFTFHAFDRQYGALVFFCC